MTISGQSCFVTGGAGFIGSELVDRLLAHDNRVTVFDSFVSGRREWIAPHLDCPRFRLVEADLLEAERLTAAMRGHDIVWHFGANTDIPGGTDNVRLDLENCTIATHNVLEAMRAGGVSRLVFPSTAAIYGDVPLQPLRETFGPVLPISLYGAGKLACEGLISSYSHLFGLQAWIFRFGNVLGERMGHGVVHDFIAKLRRDPGELEILGDGKQEKNYFLVEECLDGIFAAVENATARCDIYNLGSDTTVTVDRIAAIVAEEMGLSGVRFRYTGGKRGWPGDAPYVLFDVAKMRSLGWEPKLSSEGAVRMAARRLLARTPA